MSRFKAGQRVVLTGTVRWDQEGYQHRDYVGVDLDCEVGLTGPDGSGASGVKVQVDADQLRRMNPSELERRDPSDEHDPQ